MNDYLRTVESVYAEAARNPDAGLCCVAAPAWRLPDLSIPQAMLEMNYGCGFMGGAARPARCNDTVLYVGVGGGLEALQFAYFTRRPGGVIAVDPVADMRERAPRELRSRRPASTRGSTRTSSTMRRRLLPCACRLTTTRRRVLAQNCLFNVFTVATIWAKRRRSGARAETGRIVRDLRPDHAGAAAAPPSPPMPSPARPLPLRLPDADGLPRRL